MRIAYQELPLTSQPPSLVQNATQYIIGLDKLDSQHASSTGSEYLPSVRELQGYKPCLR